MEIIKIKDLPLDEYTVYLVWKEKELIELHILPLLFIMTRKQLHFGQTII